MARLCPPRGGRACPVIALLAAALVAAVPLGCSAAFAGLRRLQANTWNPPTPPLPSYPCKTTLPNTAGFRVIWVRAGALVGGNGSQAKPYRSFAAAWATLPKLTRLTQGVLINVMPGIVGYGADPLWMEDVWGTATAPVIVQRAPGTNGTADLQSINVHGCSYLYFSNVTFKQPLSSDSGGDVVHFAACDYIYLLGVAVLGQPTKLPHEAVKVNQVMGMYIEDSRVSVADDNTLDFVAVQYGHVCRSTFDGSNWGLYAKGGSAYLLIDSNYILNAGESGLRIGQGTGFEYMTAPFLNYEAYDIRVTNNLIRNVWGAGLGVAGGYNILVAHNSVYQVGARSHLVEFVFGERSCDNDDALPNQCTTNKARGGWGPANRAAAVPIPSRNVYFLNNLIVNAVLSQWTQFSIQARPTDTTPGPAPIPNASVTANLRISGNVIINRGKPLGIEEACPPTHPTCSEARVMANNTFSLPGGLSMPYNDTKTMILSARGRTALSTAWKPAALLAFPGWGTPLPTPAGQLTNAVPFDRNGVPRTARANFPGALV